ncbi:hypothetical protein [Mammaliicoccus sciuri]|uniref:hypothetical protein n=1 Tax=Mammaliicoccus sciuri TaxID=1296 RepID=UPI0013300CA1|nr:hypothetical protein [Mammaliicoccus sciuri]
MAYEYEEFLIKQFNEAYRAGNLKQINLIKELKEVYAKAKAFDEIEKSIIQIKCNYKGNEERINKFIARETEYIMDRKEK